MPPRAPRARRITDGKSVANASMKHCGQNPEEEEMKSEKVRQLERAQEYAKVEEAATKYAKKKPYRLVVAIEDSSGTVKNQPYIALLDENMQQIVRDMLQDLAEAAGDGIADALKGVVDSDSF